VGRVTLATCSPIPVPGCRLFSDDGEAEHEEEIRMWPEDDMWVMALEMLDEAVALHNGEIGIDPEDNTTGDTELPEFMQ